MTSIATTHPPATDAGTPERRLRRTLQANAATSGLGGVAMLVFGEPVAELLGVDAVTVVRLVGAGLLAFAVYVVAVSRSERIRLEAEVLAISAGDVVWVLGSAVTVALGWYSATGVVVVAAVALMVADFAVAQILFRRRMTSPRDLQVIRVAAQR